MAANAATFSWGAVNASNRAITRPILYRSAGTGPEHRKFNTESPTVVDNSPFGKGLRLAKISGSFPTRHRHST